MQPRCSRWQRAVRAMTPLALLPICALLGFADPQPAKNDPPKPLPQEIVKEWKRDKIVSNLIPLLHLEQSQKITTEQEEFFKDNDSILYFNNTADMVDKVRYALGTPLKMERLRELAMKNALPHSYHARCAQLLSALKDR